MIEGIQTQEKDLEKIQMRGLIEIQEEGNR